MRVLFFGVTGVDKRAALDRLARWVERFLARPKPRVIDLDGEYLFNPERGGKDWYGFLDDEHHSQRRLWSSAWANLVADLGDDNSNEDLFLSMHACIVRGYYGVRSVIDPAKIARELRPDLIVTLLDDVYDMWWRTEARAHGEPWAGRPTFEQLLVARRAELIMADQVAFLPETPIQNFLISMAHPCKTLANRIYSPRPTIVYLCFPISAPRDLEKEGDLSGKEEVTAFLRNAYERQRRSPDLVFVCPLGIDELPLLAAAKEDACRTLVFDEEANKEIPAIVFDRDARRWSLASLWPSDECLTPGPPDAEDRRPIPQTQLQDASGMVATDVGWRDYRLIAQAKQGCLAAFNPKFRNRPDVSRSVYEEIRFASTRCPVFVYQDKLHDPDNAFERHYPQGGTMRPGPGSQMVSQKQSVNDVFDAIEELARRRAR